MKYLIMILLVSALILVHEFGHYIAARLCGVRVPRFGIGLPFGPSWKLFKLGHTTFYLHAFLFGGYVLFPDDIASMEKEEDKKEDKKKEDEDDIEYLPSDSPELYENKTILQKLFIVSAGVLMNLLFAVVLVVACAVYYHKLPTSYQNIYIDSISSSATSNIASYDIKKGDKIKSVNNSEIQAVYQFTFFIKNSRLFDDYAQKDLVEKNLASLKKLNPEIKDIIPSGTSVNIPSPAAENPLKVNKNVLKGLEKYKRDGIKLSKSQIELRDKVYNQKTYTPEDDIELNDLALALSDTYKPLTIVVTRDNKDIILKDIKLSKEGALGVMLQYKDIYSKIKTPKDVIVKSCSYLYTKTVDMIFSLWQLVAGKINATDMHGIVAIVKVGGDMIAFRGMLDGILLTALISINLAIINFLPIPALDGGHVMFLLIEKITGKKPSKELGEKITEFFFVLLIILMIVITYNDIFAIVTKKL